MTERQTGRAARQARRKERRRAAKHHGTPIPDPEHTTQMVIPEHIAALGPARPPESADSGDTL